MKFLKYTLLIAMTCAFSSSALAETKVAVVDIQNIMRDSAAAKSINSQLETKQKSYQSELKKKEAEMQKERKSLESQRATLSPEAFEKKVIDFRKKEVEIQKDVQQKKSKLDRGYTQALNEIQKSVNGIITDMAKEKGFTLAIPSSQLLYAEPSMDITSEVLSRLNKKLPKVSVSFK